jgi:hypothetical protein
MLTQIDVICDNPFYISVLGARPRDSLILERVTGLGPPDISLFVGDYAKDGGLYTGRRVHTRNPVMDLKINPNHANGETVDGWRDILYKAFVDPLATGDDVTLVLHDDIKPDRIITGYTEKFLTEAFEKDTRASISMICPDPYIRDLSETEIVPPEGTTGWQTVPFTYAGTAEAGFEAWILVQATTTTLTLENNGRTMVLTYPSFQSGDVVYINTTPGHRKINLTRGGVEYDILYTLFSESPWLDLHSQQNTLQIYGETPDSVVAAITKLAYTQLYWGV